MSLLLLGAGGGNVVVEADVVDSYAGKYTTRHLDGLLAYWAMDETAGSEAVALPSSNYKGLYSGVTLDSTAGPIDASGAPSFDGVNDRLRITPSTYMRDTFPASSGTFSIWFKRSDYSSLRPLLNLWGNTGTSQNVWFRQSSLGAVSIRRGAGNKFPTITSTAVFASSDTWYHAAITWDESDDLLELYVDGVSVGSASSIGVWDASSLLSSGDIGNRAGISGPWAGFLSHAALWNKELDTSAVANIASTALTSGGP